MGVKLVKYFDYIKEKQGLTAQMKLAMKTGYSTPKAQESPDSPELLAKFEAAVKEILGPSVDVPKF